MKTSARIVECNGRLANETLFGIATDVHDLFTRVHDLMDAIDEGAASETWERLYDVARLLSVAGSIVNRTIDGD